MTIKDDFISDTAGRDDQEMALIALRKLNETLVARIAELCKLIEDHGYRCKKQISGMENTGAVNLRDMFNECERLQNRIFESESKSQNFERSLEEERQARARDRETTRGQLVALADSNWDKDLQITELRRQISRVRQESEHNIRVAQEVHEVNQLLWKELAAHKPESEARVDWELASAPYLVADAYKD